MGQALQKYKKGRSLSASERGLALKQAVQASDRQAAQKRRLSARAKATMGSAARTGGALATAATTSYISGRFGDRVRPGGYDPRPVLGVIATGVSLVQEYRGGRGAAVAGALGDGVLASWVCEGTHKMGVEAGVKARGGASASVPDAGEPPKGDIGADEVPVRRIVYSPEPVSGDPHLVPVEPMSAPLAL